MGGEMVMTNTMSPPSVVVAFAMLTFGSPGLGPGDVGVRACAGRIDGRDAVVADVAGR